MELTLNQTYMLTGKVESINQGAHFCNTTIVTADSEHLNLKLEFEQLESLKLGKIYRFEALAVPKNEDDLVLKCVAFDPAEEVLKDEELAHVLDTFYTYAPEPMMTIKKGIEGYLAKIENPVLKAITDKIYRENEQIFYVHPAATKFHHAYVGGLSYHTLTMLRLIDPFITVYPYLDRDVLYAATILHDMSKIDEISGVDGEYTKEGQLMGHLVMQAVEIDRAARELGYADTEEALLLKHMIISHHGLMNFGSPKKPQTGEALLLWYIDTIDSKLTVLGEAFEETQAGTFTQMISVLDRMRFYKDKLKK